MGLAAQPTAQFGTTAPRVAGAGQVHAGPGRWPGRGLTRCDPLSRHCAASHPGKPAWRQTRCVRAPARWSRAAVRGLGELAKK